MNVDEAIEEARRFGEQEPKDMLFAEHIAIELAAEVERLRAELEKERMRLAACGVVAMLNTKESLSKVMAEIHPDYLCASVDDVKRAVEREIELRAELAAAKAASVCPVEIAALGDADWEYSVCVRCESDDDANKLFDWLWERIEKRGEQ